MCQLLRYFCDQLRQRTTFALTSHVPCALNTPKMRLHPSAVRKRMFGVFSAGNMSGGYRCHTIIGATTIGTGGDWSPNL